MMLAAVIALREAQIPAAPGSSSELTTIVVLYAATLVSAKTTVIATASAARIVVAVHCRAAAEVVHPSPAWRIAEFWLTIVTSAVCRPKRARRVGGPDALVLQVSVGHGLKTRAMSEQYKKRN
jgi:hypothetical protein